MLGRSCGGLVLGTQLVQVFGQRAGLIVVFVSSRIDQRYLYRFCQRLQSLNCFRLHRQLVVVAPLEFIPALGTVAEPIS